VEQFITTVMFYTIKNLNIQNKEHQLKLTKCHGKKNIYGKLTYHKIM